MRRPIAPGISMPPDFFGAALDATGAAAACTSAARISPPAPEPQTLAISTPNSLARRLAFGEILALATAEGSGIPAAIGATCVFARAAGGVDWLLLGGFSPGAKIQAMVRP